MCFIFVSHHKNLLKNKNIYLQSIRFQLILIKNDLALNNPQGFICNYTK